MSNFQTFQLLTDLLGVLKAVHEDPDTLKKWADEAYSLGASGEQKIKDAHALMAQIESLTENRDALLAESENVKVKTHAALMDLASRNTLHEAALAQFEKIKHDFELDKATHAKNVEALEEDKRALGVATKVVTDRSSALDARAKDLDKQASEIETRKQATQAYELALREKGEKLRTQTTALLA